MLNNKITLEAYASIHDQQQNIIFTIHAKVILLKLKLWEMVQTLQAGGDSMQKWRWLTITLGIKLKTVYTILVFLQNLYFVDI